MAILYTTFIGKRLGVSVGQPFIINGHNDIIYKLNADGTFITQPQNVSGASVYLLKAIESGKHTITKIKSYTNAEIEFAQKLYSSYPNMSKIEMIKIGKHRVVVTVNTNDGSDIEGKILILPNNIYNWLNIGECVNILDVIKYSKYIKENV